MTLKDNTKRALNLAKMAKLTAALGVIMTEEAGGIENIEYTENGPITIVSAPLLGTSLRAFENGVALRTANGSFIQFYPEKDPTIRIMPGETNPMLILLLAKTMVGLA